MLADTIINIARKGRALWAIYTPQNRLKQDGKWDFMAKTHSYMFKLEFFHENKEKYLTSNVG